MPQSGLGLVIDRLACPVCQGSLTLAGATLDCAHGHAFDVARQGYVSLFAGGPRASTGDTAAMVLARERFLASGHYRPLAAAVNSAIGPEAAGLAVELAGGTGYYLAAALEHHPELLGLDLDLSIPALRRAARAHARLAAVATDVWQRLPVRSATATRVLSIFGPRNLPEISRVLEPGGRLILVTPTVLHLDELVSRLGLVTVDRRKQARVDDQFQGWVREATELVEYGVQMTRTEVLDDVLMGPSAHHVDPAVLARSIEAMSEPVSVSISVTVSVFCPPPSVPA